MQRVVFILIDGLSVKAMSQMGFLNSYATQSNTCYGTLNVALPHLSRPNYATIFSGKPPLETRITHNKAWKMPRCILKNSFFSLMADNNYTCAAAAYYWMYELFIGEAFEPHKHRMYFSSSRAIQHGIFYSNDEYPDSHVLQDAEFLRSTYNPNFLLIHSMGVDYAGHTGKKKGYKNATHNIDTILAEYLPAWLNENYMVIITSDHGMKKDGTHNDISPKVNTAPFWILGSHTTSPQAPSDISGWHTLLIKHFNL